MSAGSKHIDSPKRDPSPTEEVLAAMHKKHEQVAKDVVSAPSEDTKNEGKGSEDVEADKKAEAAAFVQKCEALARKVQGREESSTGHFVDLSDVEDLMEDLERLVPGVTVEQWRELVEGMRRAFGEELLEAVDAIEHVGCEYFDFKEC